MSAVDQATTTAHAEVTPERILEIGGAYCASKTLMSAVELGLFTHLSEGPKSGQELEALMGLHPRATSDFLDALVAMRMLTAAGFGRDRVYANSPETAAFLDRNSPRYIGGSLEMSNARLYRFWADLTPALQTGQPQNEIKHSKRSMFEELYADPARLEQFLHAMIGDSQENFLAFASKFDFSRFRTLADIGGATGQLSCIVASRHPHLSCTSYDLPIVTPIARRIIAERGMAERVGADDIDFFKDEFPKAELITMGMILHDWNLERKKHLIAKAYRALPEGGALIAIEHLIDDERRTNLFGLLMSLNMLIEFGDAFDFTGADFAGWCREAGFSRSEILPLTGPASAAIAYK